METGHQTNCKRGINRCSRIKPSRIILCLSVLTFSCLSGCTAKPVQETVTTDASRSSALPPNVEPVAVQPDLPARDADIETAGDRIAEAITYLHTRKRDRHESALRALNQAEAALNRALRARPREDDATRTALRSMLKDLDTAERAVARTSPDALRQLATLNKSLDNLPESK